MWIRLKCWSRNSASSSCCHFCLFPIVSSLSEEDINVTNPLSEDDGLTNPFLCSTPTQEQQSSLRTFTGTYNCQICGLVNSNSSKICIYCHEDPESFWYQSGNLSGIQPSTSSYQPVVHDESPRFRNKFLGIKFNWSKNLQFKKKKFFLDESFDLKYSSLAASPNVKKFTDIHWCPPYKINCQISSLLRNWTVFPNTFNSSDIIQGNLGNCWIASALASLAATRPDLIKRQILTKNYNEVGVYALQYYIEGFWQSIVIDGMLPCDKKGNVAFGQVKSKQLYFALIEKGFAKLRGSYQALEGGTLAEAFNIMTGFPCKTLKIHDPDNNQGSDHLWNEIFKAKQDEFPMAVSSDEETNKNFEKVSLHSRHGYSVLDVREENLNVKKGKTHDDDGSVKLLKLRDPLGCSSWKGDWSDHSRLWSQNSNLRRLLNPNLNLSTEGKFWISFYDFCDYFVSVDICKDRDDWIIAYKFGTFPESIAGAVKGFILIVNKYTEIYLNLFQQLSKLKSSLSTRHPVDACIAIYLAHEDEHGRLYRGALVASSKRQACKLLSCECSLHSGKYVVIPFAFNHEPIDQSQRVHITPVHYVLAVHSIYQVSLDPYTFDLSLSGQNWSEALIELVIKKGKMRINKQKNTRDYTLSDNGLILVFENHNSHETALVLYGPSKSENIRSSRGQLDTIDVVPPLHRMLVTNIGQLDRNQRYTLNYKLIVHTKPVNTDLNRWNLRGQNHVPALTSAVDLHQPRPFNLCS